MADAKAEMGRQLLVGIQQMYEQRAAVMAKQVGTWAGRSTVEQAGVMAGALADVVRLPTLVDVPALVTIAGHLSALPDPIRPDAETRRFVSEYGEE